MPIESIDTDAEDMRLLEGAEETEEAENDSSFPSFRDRDTVEIGTDYVSPLTIKSMREKGKNEEEIRAMLKRIRQRRISLIVEGYDSPPTDVYEEVFGKE